MLGLKWALGIMGAIAFVILIGVVGWQFDWWLTEKNVDRKVQIENRNTGTQTAWHDEAVNLINQASLIEGTPQEAALKRQACELIARLTDTYMSDDLVTFQAQEC